jgi:hypothetical protein
MIRKVKDGGVDCRHLYPDEIFTSLVAWQVFLSLVIAKKQSWNWSFDWAAFTPSRHRSSSPISL